MYASGLLWAAGDPIATILAYAIDHAWAIRQPTRLSHACEHQATWRIQRWKGREAMENSGWRGGQNVRGIILNLCAPLLFVGHYVGHEERKRERFGSLYFLVLEEREEFFAYFCGWRERVNIFRKEIRIPMFVYTVGEETGCERIEIYWIALFMEIMALFAKIEEKKFDINIYIFISCEE